MSPCLVFLWALESNCCSQLWWVCGGHFGSLACMLKEPQHSSMHSCILHTARVNGKPQYLMTKPDLIVWLCCLKAGQRYGDLIFEVNIPQMSHGVFWFLGEHAQLLGCPAVLCSLFKLSAVLFTEVALLRLIRSLYATNVNTNSCGSGAAVGAHGWKRDAVWVADATIWPVNSKFTCQLLGSRLPSEQCDVKCRSQHH